MENGQKLLQISPLLVKIRRFEMLIWWRTFWNCGKLCRLFWIIDSGASDYIIRPHKTVKISTTTARRRRRKRRRNKMMKSGGRCRRSNKRSKRKMPRLEFGFPQVDCSSSTSISNCNVDYRQHLLFREKNPKKNPSDRNCSMAEFLSSLISVDLHALLHPFMSFSIPPLQEEEEEEEEEEDSVPEVHYGG